MTPFGTINVFSGCSNAELSGTTLTIHFAIRFNPIQFAGQHHMYIELVDNQKNVPTAGDAGNLMFQPEMPTRQ